MIQDRLRELLGQAYHDLSAERQLAALPDDIHIGMPTEPGHGDFFSNIAMQLAAEFGDNPQQIAQYLVARLPDDPVIERVEVAGPGF
ncbi:MAG: arginine--tRNA ligase, partial [Armatimonadetes bacterium]|nr:arginine--tRNA ligase [Armatimonadota bacterium]